MRDATYRGLRTERPVELFLPLAMLRSVAPYDAILKLEQPQYTSTRQIRDAKRSQYPPIR